MCSFGVFWFGFCTVCCLMCMHSTECCPVHCLLPCWIGPTNCQPKWLRTRSGEKKNEEKWSYDVGRCTVNETMKNRPKQPSWFFENRTAETKFSVFEFWDQFNSVFRKPISDIFIGFHTCLSFISSPTTKRLSWIQLGASRVLSLLIRYEMKPQPKPAFGDF